MPTSTMTRPAAANPNTKPAAPVAQVPFTRAAKEHIEQFVDVSVLMTTNTQAQGPFDIPAYGYLRNIVLLLEATGGVGATTTAIQEDAPWIAISDLQIADVNGAPIIGPITGYDLYLTQKYGGYEYFGDAKQSFSYVTPVVGASASGNFTFSLKIPVEVCIRDALGAIANQNASSTYKLKITLNSSTGLYSTPPSTTLPTVRIRAFLEAWTQPPATDLRGMPQNTTPPAHGTSQYWSKYTANVPSGANTVRLSRVGNFLREVIFVNRRSASTRVNGETDFPDPFSVFWDTRLLHAYTKKIWRDVLVRRSGYAAAIDTAGGLDSGVFPYDFCHEFDNKLGRELRDGWLPTVQSTRLEGQGTFGSADALDILTNDVATAGEVFL